MTARAPTRLLPSAAFCLLLGATTRLCSAQDYIMRHVVYGKYFSNPTDGLDTTDQAYWLW